MNIDEKNIFLKQEFTVLTEVSDLYGRIRLSGFINLLVQSAIKSADSLGFGFDVLKQKNMTWMLGRLSVEIYKPVQWNQKLIIETWPKTADGLLYIRDFIVSDENEKIIARGTSGWLAVDLTKKRLINVDFLDSIYKQQKDYKSALEYFPKKIKTIQTDESFNIKATYYDLDLNKHVTAIRYFDWMMDTFDIEFHKNNFPKEIHINYMKETSLDDEILLRKKQLSENEFYFDAKNKTTDRDSFKCMLKF